MRPLAHPRDEVLDDLEVDVRLEQRQADLAHRRVDVRLGHAATTGQPGEGLAEAVAEAVEHAGAGTLVTDGEDQAARRTPGGWCAGSGDTEACGVYAMPRAGAPGRRSRAVYPPPVTLDPLLDPVPPTHVEAPLTRAAPQPRVRAPVERGDRLGVRVVRDPDRAPVRGDRDPAGGPHRDRRAARRWTSSRRCSSGSSPGAWVDRLRRRPVMIWADLGRARPAGIHPGRGDRRLAHAAPGAPRVGARGGPDDVLRRRRQGVPAHDRRARGAGAGQRGARGDRRARSSSSPSAPPGSW